MFRYLPEQGSTFAPMVDRLNYIILDISLIFTVLIVGSMIFFAVRYRKRGNSDNETPHIEGSFLLEIIWTLVPTIICIFVAVYGYIGYKEIRTVPKDALEIHVTGKKWNWSFEYENGKKTIDTFTVPVNRPIKLIITSNDVLHSFFVPGMRTKVDAVPQHYSYQWFQPVKTGPQQVYCTEYCGQEHSSMLATMDVVSEAEYRRWLEAKEVEEGTPAERGELLYTQQGCVACHSLDGSKVVGPSFLKLFGRKATFTNGEEYVVDENYIRDSILYPKNKVVAGYPEPSLMPAFELSDTQLSDIISYIKTLDGSQPIVKAVTEVAKEPESPIERGKLVYQGKACIGCHSLDGSNMVGPTWKGLYGKNGKFANGKTYVADDTYLKDSIYNPQSSIVEGYPQPSPMPSYQGQLDEKEMSDVIEFIKSLK
jgi:cytochrome c oxidase subunit II